MGLNHLSRYLGLGRNMKEHIDICVEVEVGELEGALQRDCEGRPLVLLSP